jgi:CBS domain-containing protein
MNQVKEIMHEDPVCCTPDTNVNELASLMAECDCGAIPVVEDETTGDHLMGIVTDRDIVCRILAEGKNPEESTVRDCMSSPATSVKPDDGIDTATELMRKFQIRRVPVVDGDRCVGIVTQAQIAKKLSEAESGSVLKEVSQPAPNSGSRVTAGMW